MRETSILLETTDPTVIKISNAGEYHGDGHFQKAFASIYKMTPAAYRKQL